MSASSSSSSSSSSIDDNTKTPILGTYPTNGDNTLGLAFSDTQNYIGAVDLSDLAATAPTKVDIKYVDLFINNEFVPAVSGKRFNTVNPTNGEVITTVAEADKADVDKAVAAARVAFEKTWRHVGPNARANLLLRFASLLERDINILSAIESLDQGKTYGIAKVVDVTEAISTFRYYAGWASKISGKTIEVDGAFEARTVHEPFGVVGAIVPWNFPILMATWKLAPCLAAGNCIVIKSSEKTPLSLLHIASLFKEAGFPPGVVNVLNGYGPTAGAALSLHNDVDKIAFTGSTATGRRILAASAESNLKKVTLELGGKSPAIVFPDVNLDEAVAGTLSGLFFNAAQVCTAASRTFVHESIYDDFVAKARAGASQIQLTSASSSLLAQGPLVDDIQFKNVTRIIDEAKKSGAKLECGGAAAEGKGYYVQPTVFSDVKDNYDFAKNEIFGPVLSIFKFSTIEEVIRRANDTPYGLAASIWTNDLNVANVVAGSLRAGTVWINCHNAFSRAIPFGGFKQSGIGRDLGEYALNEYTTVKAITTAIPKGLPAMPARRQ